MKLFRTFVAIWAVGSTMMIIGMLIQMSPFVITGFSMFMVGAIGMLCSDDF